MFLCLPRKPISARKIAVGRPIRLGRFAVLLSGLFGFGFIGRAVGRPIGSVGRPIRADVAAAGCRGLLGVAVGWRLQAMPMVGVYDFAILLAALRAL